MFAVDTILKLKHFCTTGLGIFSGAVLGIAFSILCYWIIRQAGGDKILYFNTVSSNNIYCSKPKKQQFKSNNVCADSAFKSHTKREFLDFDKIKNLPAPGTYNVNDDFTHDSSKIPYSSFSATNISTQLVPSNQLKLDGDYIIKPYFN